MPNPWFRLYSEFEDDPKVLMLPDAMQARLIFLMCERCKQERRTEAQRAFKWRISMAELQATKQAFIDAGFIDEQWNLNNWNKRQFISDSSTDRVRKHRVNQALKQNETLHETGGNVTVTAPDTDTDTEQKHKEQLPSPPPAASELSKDQQKLIKAEAKKLAQQMRAAERAREKEKARQAKPPSVSDEAKLRHKLFKAAIFEYWKAKNDIDCPWDQQEGAQLEMWLKACPTVEISKFTQMLRNRYKSDINHSERPSKWIKNITDFANSPINKRNGGNNGHKKSNFDVLRESLAEDQARIDGGGDAEGRDDAEGCASPLLLPPGA